MQMSYKDKMTEKTTAHADAMGCLVSMLTEPLRAEIQGCVREMLEQTLAEVTHAVQKQNAPVWATRKELAQRLNCQPTAIDSYLVAAEESGKVRVLLMDDGYGKRSVKRYHIAEFERFFTLRRR